MKGSHFKHYNANCHSPLLNVVLDSASRDPKRTDVVFPFPEDEV